MTDEELRQQLAAEKLAQTGLGAVSPRTFEDLCAKFGVQDRISTLDIGSIRIVVNQYVEDSKIIPFEYPSLKFPKFKL